MNSNKIDYLRRLLGKLVADKGLTDEETVKVSQQLDKELNKYLKLYL